MIIFVFVFPYCNLTNLVIKSSRSLTFFFFFLLDHMKTMLCEELSITPALTEVLHYMLHYYDCSAVVL